MTVSDFGNVSYQIGFANNLNWWTGTTAPAPAMGANGDWFTDTLTGNVYQKASGSWSFQMNLIGPQGSTGSMGPAGATGTPGTLFQTDSTSTAADGVFTWSFPQPYTTGVVPRCNAIAIGPNPGTGTIVNVQLEGTPTNTSAKFRVTRSNVTAVALLGLNILSIPASPGSTVLQLFATSP